MAMITNDWLDSLSAEGTFGKQNLRNRFDCAKMEPSFDRKRQKMTWTRG